MKQIQLLLDNADTFRKELLDIQHKFPNCHYLIHLFYDKDRQPEIQPIVDFIHKEFPQAHCLGCSSNANIENGMINENSILAVCTIFEEPDTKIEIFQYSFNAENQSFVCDDLLEQVKQRPWVKAVELLITLRDMSTTYFCDRLSEMDEHIQIFGGCAFNENLDRYDVSIFSEHHGFLEEGAVFVLFGGEHLHIRSSYITGWKPLGKKMRITCSEANRLYELGGKPAYDTYYRYLKIENDEFFYRNTLEFPIFYERNGINVLRVPAQCLEDGSLIMTSDLPTGALAQISYGDPQTILKSIFHEAETFADFVPDGIMIFDCASRRTFWGNEDINRESLPFQTIADTAGFYTGGEFHRFGKSLNQHNVTLVIVGMREDVSRNANKSSLLKEYHYNNEHISMVRRLANFIDVASHELDETNHKLEAMNERLLRMATIDELTNVFNRREIHQRIIQAAQSAQQFSLIMLDLDNFKKINDTYGHDEGDAILKSFSSIMQSVAESVNYPVSIGRWGGEEFMILTEHADAKTAYELSEKIRKTFAAANSPVSGHHTVSCGVTQAKPEESADSVCTRVDHVLYHSKHNGRNQTSIEEVL